MTCIKKASRKRIQSSFAGSLVQTQSVYERIKPKPTFIIHLDRKKVKWAKIETRQRKEKEYDLPLFEIY